MAIERIVSSAHSKSLWQKKISEFNLEPILQWEGVEGKHRTAICYLQKEGVVLTKGAGKGIDEMQIELSASYEALENYLASYHFFQREIQFATIRDIKKQYQPISIRCQPSFLKMDSDEILPWVIASEYRKKQDYAIPLATVDITYSSNRLLEDTFNYPLHHFYASTNGLACSATYEEALIHSISEIIERDAISYFLLNTFLLKEPIHVVNKASLPEYLQTLILELEKQYEDDILLVHFPSRYQVPVYCAIFTRQKDYKIPLKGFGASLNAGYAVERAVLESLQTVHVSACFPEVHIDLSTTQMLEYPVLFDCVRFDLMELVVNGKYQVVNFNPTPYNLGAMGIVDYLEILVEKVYQLSPLILVDKILGSNDGFSCLNVVIPGTEEFFHVFNDLIIAPLEQTRNYIKDKQKLIEKVF